MRGGKGLQAVGSGGRSNGNLNGNGHAPPVTASSPPGRTLTPAQILLGAPAGGDATPRSNSNGTATANGNGRDYQPLADGTSPNNARRQVYQSVAEDPNPSCCSGCVVQ